MILRATVLLCLMAAQVMAQEAPVVWRLVSLNGAAFAGRATLSYLADGTLQGEGPCNGFGAALQALPPEWAMGPVRATRMACDGLEAETAFFAALEAMTGAVVTTDSLTLTGPDGTMMVFAASGG